MGDAQVSRQAMTSAALDPLADCGGTTGLPSEAIRSEVTMMRERDARGRRTMETLHRALLALIDERSFDHITVYDIAERARCSRSTFYRHYADKDALLEEIARQEIVELMKLVLPIADFRDTMPNCRRVIGHVATHRSLWSVLLTGGAIAVMRQKFVELATPEASPDQSIPGYAVPVDLSASWGVAATVEVIAWWLRNPDKASEEEVAGYLDRLAVRPALDHALPLTAKP